MPIEEFNEEEEKDLGTQKNEETNVFEESSDKEPQEVTEAPKKEKMIPETEVEGMLENMFHKLKNDFEKRFALLSAKASLDSDESYVDGLVDDWMEAPAIFFSFSDSFTIHGDRKKGKSTEPPNGPVKFTNIIRSKKKGRKGVQVIAVSSVYVQSKSEAEYIRNHSQFGIKFFENMTEALIADTNWAARLVEANNSIHNLSDQSVIARCQMEGLPLGTDPDSMRRALVEHVAKKTMEVEERQRLEKYKNAVLEEGADGVKRFTEEKTITTHNK